MAWTAPRTWVASEIVTAAIMNTHVRDNLNALNGYVKKAADTVYTSNAVQANDPHLSLAIPAAGSYLIDVYLWATSAANAAGDLRVGFAFPAGTMDYSAYAADDTLASGSVQAGQWAAIYGATSGTSFLAVGLSTSMLGIHVHGSLVATASGTLNFQAAQFNSNASSSTVKARSHMTLQQGA